MADYVIVGAGSAGCVLAARLSESPGVTVLLLEAGGPDTVPELHVPAMFPIVFKSSLDWDLLGEPEPGLGGRRLYLPRGRVIGGSGSINAMIYLRGHRADFDGWAADGCTGWSPSTWMRFSTPPRRSPAPISGTPPTGGRRPSAPC